MQHELQVRSDSFLFRTTVLTLFKACSHPNGGIESLGASSPRSIMMGKTLSHPFEIMYEAFRKFCLLLVYY